MIPSTISQIKECPEVIRKYCDRNYMRFPTGSRLLAALEDKPYTSNSMTWWGSYNEARVRENLQERYNWNLYNPFPKWEIGKVSSQPDAIILNYVPPGKSESVEAILEIKCPYNGKLPHKLSIAYYVQCCAEMECYGKSYGIVAVWTPMGCKIFQVQQSPMAWTLIMQKLEKQYSRMKFETNIKRCIQEFSTLLTVIPKDDSPLFVLSDLE